MNYTYNEVKEQIKRFCASHSAFCSLLECDDLCGQVIYEFDQCVMGISFGEIDWGPYYMTSIEVRALDDKVPMTHKSGDLVFFFYDSRENTIEDIESALSEAYQYASAYNKSMLSARINQSCTLVDSWRLGIHPDDEEYSGRDGVNLYKCVGTFAQYYVLSDGKSEFRVLDKCIQWI